jgi:hypothetical protein
MSSLINIYWVTALLTLLIGGVLWRDAATDRRVKCLRAAIDKADSNRRQLVRLAADLTAYAVRCEEILGQLQRIWTSPENHEIVDNVDALQAAWCRVAESRPPLSDLGRLLTASDWRAIEERPTHDRT